METKCQSPHERLEGMEWNEYILKLFYFDPASSLPLPLFMFVFMLMYFVPVCLCCVCS